MQKRYVSWLLSLSLLLSLALTLTSAQESPFAVEESTVSEEEFAEEVELIEDRAGTTPDSALYVVDDIIEDINLAVRDGESKAEYALQVKQEKVAEASLMLSAQKSKETAEALQKAKSVSSVIQDELSPQLQALAKENGEFSQKLLAAMEKNTPEEWDDVNVLISEQFTEEEKIKIASSLVTKIADYCEELSYINYDEMLKDQHCNPSNAPEWLKEMIEGELAQREEESKKQLVSELTACVNDPRDCNCENIPVEEHRKGCEENKALAIRCEFEEDMSACDELDTKSLGGEDVPEFLRGTFESTMTELIAKKEKEMFAKFAPKECIEAGVSTREECESIMREKYGEPPEECMKEGKFIGEKACMAIMIEKHDIPSECIKDGKPVTREECESLMVSSGKIPAECVDGGQFIGREACEEKMIATMVADGRIPEQCVENGVFIGKEECETKMKEQGAASGGAPEACMEDGQFIGQEECETKMREQGIAEGMSGGPGGAPSECMQDGEFIGQEECERVFQEKMGQSGMGQDGSSRFGTPMPSEGQSAMGQDGSSRFGTPMLPEGQPSQGQSGGGAPGGGSAGGFAGGSASEGSAGGSLTIPTIPDASTLGRVQPGGDQVLIMSENGGQLVHRDELVRAREEAERNAGREGEHGAAADGIRAEIEQLQQDRENAGSGERGEARGDVAEERGESTQSSEESQSSEPEEQHEEAREESVESSSSEESSESSDSSSESSESSSEVSE